MFGLVLLSVVESLPLPSTTSLRVSGEERSCVSLSIEIDLLPEVSCHGALALGHAFALMMIGISLIACSLFSTRVVLVS